MGYKKEVLATYNRGTIVEARITETADICQLLSNGYMIMMDEADLVKAREGKSIHVLIQNIETGNISSRKYYKLDPEIDDSLWIRNAYKHTYETEFDYS